MNRITKLVAAAAAAMAFAGAANAADTVRIGYQNEPDPSHAAIVAGEVLVPGVTVHAISGM